MSLTPLVTTIAAETSAEGINPWIIGIIAFAILMALLGGLLAFAAGRPHS